MGKTIDMDVFLKEENISEEALSGFFRKAISKFAKSSVQAWMQGKKSSERRVLTKNEALSSFDSLDLSKGISLLGPVGPESDCGPGLFISILQNPPAPEGFKWLEASYQPIFSTERQETTRQEEDFFIEFCRFVADSLSPRFFTVNTGKGAHIDSMLSALSTRDFSNISEWAGNALFIGEGLVDEECIGVLSSLKSLGTERVSQGVFLLLRPISSKRLEDRYGTRTGTLSEMNEYRALLADDKKLLESIANATKGHFR